MKPSFSALDHSAPTVVKKPRILIVEDEAIVALDIRQQLVELGYEPVGLATQAEQAIAMAGELRPNLVLMDVQLAGALDGIAAAQAIRTQFDLPVVFLTAFAADDILARARLTEPFGYILKPFSERELRTVLEMALYKHQAEVKLRDTALHTQTVLDNMLDAVITINAQGLMESFNKAACHMFGYAPEEVLGRNVAMLMPEPHRSHHDGYLQHHESTGEARIVGLPREVQGLRKDGGVFPMSLSVSRIWHSGKATFIGLIRDISRSRQDEEEIHRLAYFDPLTGLANRRLLMDRLRQAMLTSTRTARHGALMFLDLDHFKLLNDSRGHMVGDVLLQQVASRLTASVREGDSVARLGGDEFVVLLTALSGTDHEAATQAKAIANKILDPLGQPYELLGQAHTSTPSIGIVVFMGESEAIDDLLKKADVAMYQAKAAGRNTARFFDPGMQAAAMARNELELDMLRGLANEEFMLHYQVQVDGTGRPTGAEALARWNSPKRGMVWPSIFIPLAEETGLILPLGQWVLETACAQLVEWAKAPETVHWTMAVNVSALQFAQSDFVTNVVNALQKTGARPHLLKLELTESMLVDDVQDVITKMNAIKGQGVNFSLDDFGTGYSSLSHLKRLPLDQLKIDQSFVNEVLIDPNDAVIARTIVALGHSLGLTVIAEGVETEAQRDFLVSIGCDAFQGYYFGRPGAPDKLTAGVSKINL